MRTLLIPFVLLLAACGQKGPLYLPQDPAQPAVSSASAASAPAATSQTGTANAPVEKDNEEKKEPSQLNTEAEAVTK